MKALLLILAISVGLMAEEVVNCVDYGGGITICTDEDGESIMIVKS